MFDAIKPLLESGLITQEVGQELSEAWESRLTEAREQVRPVLEAMVVDLQALDSRSTVARKALREAALAIPGAVVGEGAAWRLVRDAWTTYEGAGRARTSGELTAHDLLALGYEVRTIARCTSLHAAIRSFEVWAWTCEDGARIAPHQVPVGEVPEPPIRWSSLAADAVLEGAPEKLTTNR